METRVTRLLIPNLITLADERVVAEALRHVPGVADTETDMRSQSAIVHHVPGLDAQALREAIEELGYVVHELDPVRGPRPAGE